MDTNLANQVNSPLGELLAQSIDQALEFRVFSLEQQAQMFRVEMEAAKFSAVSLLATGVVLSANPVFQALAALGFVGYAWTMFRDYQISKQFCPIPCLRKNFLSLLEGAGLPDESQQISTDPLEDVLGFLPPLEAHEYELLSVAGDRVGSYLSRIEPGKRLAGYRYLLRQTRLRNTLKLPDFGDLQEAVSFVTPLVLPEASPTTIQLALVDAIAPAQPVVETAQAKPKFEPVDTHQAEAISVAEAIPVEVEIVDPADYLVGRLKPTLISAVPRVGKGVILSHAWRRAKMAYPDLTVWVIQPKPHPRELGYWEGVDRFWGKMLENYPVNDPHIIEEIESFILEWRNHRKSGHPTILILDELVKLEACLPTWFKKYIPSLMKVESSSGETDNRFLWGVTQSPLVSDLGLTGGNRASFELLALENEESADHLASLQRSYGSIPDPKPGQYKKAYRGTIWYHSALKAWGGVPKYEVFQPTRKPQQPQTSAAPSKEDIEAIAQKLDNWLNTTGKPFSEDGWYTAPILISKFKYWDSIKKKTCSINKPLLEEAAKLLISQGKLKFDKQRKAIAPKTQVIEELVL